MVGMEKNLLDSSSLARFSEACEWITAEYRNGNAFNLFGNV
jgi:hypothetical protein